MFPTNETPVIYQLARIKKDYNTPQTVDGVISLQHYYRETDSLWIVMSPFSPAAKPVKRTKSSVLPTRGSKVVSESKCSPYSTRSKCALSSVASIRVSKSVVDSMLPVSSPCLPSPPTPSTPARPQFGTFGKKAGARLLAKLRMNETWCSEK